MDARRCGVSLVAEAVRASTLLRRWLYQPLVTGLRGLIAALASATLGHAQMLTPGEFSVSAGGAASYQIKLRVPQGIAGLVPDLALGYNSQGGNGSLGVGFNLIGLSAITRCAQTPAQDGLGWAGGINFTMSDRYCLDGQRLFAVRNPANPNAAVGAYGADGTFYSTEVESFSKVQSSGWFGAGVAPNGQAYFGPTSFIVKTKSGLTMEYGTTADSRITAAAGSVVTVWALSKIIDTKGNAMSVTYNAADAVNGQFYPVRIAYAPDPSSAQPTSPASWVDFEYDAIRPDTAPAFLAGQLIRPTVRLTKVKMLRSGAAIREYRIAYRNALASARSAVESIQECAANGQCLPATNFEWTYPAASWTSTPWTGGASPATPIDGQCISADFNGDGRTDLACMADANIGRWHVTLSSGSGWISGPGSYWDNGPKPGNPVGGQCVTGDFNADGKSDLACYTGTQGQTWQMAFSTGSGWNASTSWPGAMPGVPVSGQCFTGDFDADARTDLACYTGSNGVWHVTLSQGNGWASQYWHNGPQSTIPVYERCMSGDFNGDGRTDLACWTTNGGSWHLALSTGYGWQSQFWNNGPVAGFPIGDRCQTGDFNGDGKTDIGCYTGSGGSWHIALSRGAGDWFAEYWLNGPQPRLPTTEQCRVGDYNGDGKTDIACQANYSGDWVVSLSKGTAWATTTWPAGPQAGDKVGVQCVTGDFTGHGRSNLACYTGTGGSWVVTAPASEPNLIVNRIHRGSLGDVANVTYVNPTRTLGSHYTRDVVLSSPQLAIVPGAPVVQHVDVPNGVGGTRRTSYWYDTAVAEPSTGRGFLGFKSQKRVDVATGIATTTTYRQDFPFAGQIDFSSTVTAGGSTLTHTSSTYACKDPAAALATACTFAAGRRYFVYPEVATAKAWDLNGAAMPWARTTNQSPDAYGNFQTVLTETLNSNGSTSDYSKTVSSLYYNDPSNWILGRLLTTSVASSGPTVVQPVVPGSGGLPAAPPPQLPPPLAAIAIMPVILDLLLSD